MSPQPLPAITEAATLSAAASRRPGTDLLLLDSAAPFSPEAIAEMQEVLYAHERHGVVSPWTGPIAIWQSTATLLPRYQLVPTADCACLLIKAEVLDRFGGFDGTFESLPASIDDFICRINRRGYSAIRANRAHMESGINQTLTDAERELLLFRYPEYEHKFAFYEEFERDPLDQFALLRTPHRPRILYDLFHLTGNHSGTSDFGLNLLRELARLLEDEFDLYVGTHFAERSFLSELAGYRLYDDTSRRDKDFDLAFKPCQFFSWTDFRRLDRLAPRIAFTMLDLIGVRCDYLNSPARQLVLQHAVELSDYVFTLSDFAASDFSAFFGERLPLHTIHLASSGLSSDEFLVGEHVLVIGNNFAHKGIAETLPYLDIAYPVVILGGERQPAPANVRWLESGSITRQHIRDLLARARLVIYPSFYEGFGLPVVDALALGKPVVVLDTAVNRELDRALQDKNLHRIATPAALPSVLAQLLASVPAAPPGNPRRWPQVASEYATVLRELLHRDFDIAKMRARRKLLRAVAASDAAQQVRA